MKLNIHFLIVLILACIAIINDYLIFLFKLEYIYGFIIASIVTFSIILFLKQNKKLRISIDFDKTDIFIFLFFLYQLRNILYGEFWWDTTNYHIYLQENPFLDKINFDFFPGRIVNTFLFPLGDRMFYIVRFLLGYRLGTLLSYYLLIVLFYQMKRVLKTFTNSTKVASCFAYTILLMEGFIGTLKSYYVDNLSIVFIIEIFYYIYIYKENKSLKILMYIALCSGIAIGIKITTIFFLVFLIFIYFLKKLRNKQFKFEEVIIFGVIFFIPFIIYMIDNYLQTGSILFPYYNAIFKSKYFEEYNWVEPNFYLRGIGNKLIWPLIGLLNIEYGDFTKTRDISFGIGYIFIWLYIGYILLFKKNKGKLFILSLFTFIITLIWTNFLYGYMRYGRIVSFLNMLLIAIFFIEKVEKIFKYKIIKKIYNFFNNYLIFFSIIIFIGIIVWPNKYIKNINYIFKDRKSNDYQINIDGVWGCIYHNTAYEVLVRNSNTPIYNLENKIYLNKADDFKALYNQKINNSKIYVIFNSKELKKSKKELEYNNFEIVEFIKKYGSDDIPYINVGEYWYLYRVEYKAEFGKE